MAENDEYQFVDPDAFETVENVTAANAEVQQPRRGQINPPNIKRNALIAVLVLIFSVIIFQYIIHRHKPTPANIIQPARQILESPVVEKINPPSTEIAATEIVNDVHEKTDQTLSLLQDTQHNMQADLAGMNEHVTLLDDRLSTIMTSIESLVQRVDQLSTTLDTEAQRIEHVLAVRTHKPSKKFTKHKITKKSQIVTYNVEAVIPGRAWLIGTDGTTITISVGTPIQGYGRVRVIDAPQGRVLTSSGKIIRFSQNES